MESKNDKQKFLNNKNQNINIKKINIYSSFTVWNKRLKLYDITEILQAVGNLIQCVCAPHSHFY